MKCGLARPEDVSYLNPWESMDNVADNVDVASIQDAGDLRAKKSPTERKEKTMKIIVGVEQKSVQNVMTM